MAASGQLLDHLLVGHRNLYELFTYGDGLILNQPVYDLDAAGDLGWEEDMLLVIDGGDGSVFLNGTDPQTMGGAPGGK